MKPQIIFLSLCTAVGLSSCGISSVFGGESPADRIERGMSREQVRGILGRPQDRSFGDHGEEVWVYRKVDFFDNVRITEVTFFEGRVSKLNTHSHSIERREESRPLPPARPQPVPPSYPTPPPTYPEGRGYPNHRGRLRLMSPQSFQRFYNELRRLPFPDDKLRYLQDATQRNLFTCQQAEQVLRLYTFDDERLRVLTLFAQRLVNYDEAYRLINLFTFDDAKQRARALLVYQPEQGGYPDYQLRYRQMSEAGFQHFFSEFQRIPFPDDKLAYLRDVAQRNFFTVQQAERILRLFTFDDDKLSYLAPIAPRLSNNQEAYRLIELFTFDDAKGKARRLLGYR